MDKVKQIIEYEFVTGLQAFRKVSNWIYFLAIASLISTMYQLPALTFIFLILIFVLQAKRDYDDGMVTRYQREKRGILSKQQLEQLKGVRDEKKQVEERANIV